MRREAAPVMQRGKLIILLVEDEPHDVFFVKRATKASAAGHEVHAVHDGNEAIRYLRGDGRYADRHKFPLPTVILTDLKMPKMDGFDLLEWLRANPEYSVIPVIVYSSSRLEVDVRRAYRLGANAYVAKPAALRDLVEMLGLIYEFWSRCETPGARGEG